jgi:hypothetical protein
VVGIIRRNWRQYAGSIVLDEVVDKKATIPTTDIVAPDGAEDTVATQALFLPVDTKLPPVRISSR